MLLCSLIQTVICQQTTPPCYEWAAPSNATCHHEAVIFVIICLKYQQGASRHPGIMCQIRSLKNIKHILNTEQWTWRVSDCHSSDKLSALDGVTPVISILIMGILSLMVSLCFTALETDGDGACGITHTYHVITSHAANISEVTGRDGAMANASSISCWTSLNHRLSDPPGREESDRGLGRTSGPGGWGDQVSKVYLRALVSCWFEGLEVKQPKAWAGSCQLTTEECSLHIDSY